MRDLAYWKVGIRDFVGKGGTIRDCMNRTGDLQSEEAEIENSKFHFEETEE